MSALDAVILNEVKKLAASSGGSDLGYRVKRLVKGTIASGVTGDLLIANALSGQKLRLVYLNTADTNTADGISLIIDGNTYWDAVSLGSNVRFINSTYSIVRGGASSTPNAVENLVHEIECTSILITKNAGNTITSIRYVYEILEPIV